MNKSPSAIFRLPVLLVSFGNDHFAFWRFFRYENDPEKGTSADFLFIPVKRP